MDLAPPSYPAAPRRLLVRGVNWLGDAVMTAPALLRLRENPRFHLVLLTPEKLKDLWFHHPAVNEIIPFSPAETVFSIAKKLRPQKFDLALVLPNSPRSALEVFLARIPIRVGRTRPWRNFLLTQTVPPRPEAVKMRKRSVAEIKERMGRNSGAGTPKPQWRQSAHQTREYLHLAGALGAVPEPLPAKLFVTPQEIEAAANKFGLDPVPHPLFGMNPGADYGPAKRWPIEKFITVAEEIQRRTNGAWILFGGPKDTELGHQVQAAMSDGPGSFFNLAGKTSLRELMSLLKLCRAFLTNDSGPMHLAAALGVPVVAIFGSTSPALTAPLPANETPLKIIALDVPCSPCFRRECPIDFRCMNGIGVERVVQAILGLAAP
jgi:heptosyltransferase II